MASAYGPARRIELSEAFSRHPTKQLLAKLELLDAEELFAKSHANAISQIGYYSHGSPEGFAWMDAVSRIKTHCIRERHPESLSFRDVFEHVKPLP